MDLGRKLEKEYESYLKYQLAHRKQIANGEAEFIFKLFIVENNINKIYQSCKLSIFFEDQLDGPSVEKSLLELSKAIKEYRDTILVYILSKEKKDQEHV